MVQCIPNSLQALPPEKNKIKDYTFLVRDDFLLHIKVLRNQLCDLVLRSSKNVWGWYKLDFYHVYTPCLRVNGVCFLFIFEKLLFVIISCVWEDWVLIFASTGIYQSEDNYRMYLNFLHWDGIDQEIENFIFPYSIPNVTLSYSSPLFLFSVQPWSHCELLNKKLTCFREENGCICTYHLFEQ